jgi:transposase
MTMTLADAARIDDGVVSPRSDRPKRRTFTAEYKAGILAEYDAADRSERGAILRREGLYSSHIAEWRKAAEGGAASALGPKTGDRQDRQREREIEQLRARAEEAEAELAKTKAALDLVGKAHALLETLSESTERAKRPPR